MTFTAQMTRYADPAPFGGLVMTAGWYESTLGDTGGNINTGLLEVIAIFLQPHGAAVSASAPAVVEGYASQAALEQPINGKEVTIVTIANETGRWIAIGRN